MWLVYLPPPWQLCVRIIIEARILNNSLGLTGWPSLNWVSGNWEVKVAAVIFNRSQLPSSDTLVDTIMRLGPYIIWSMSQTLQVLLALLVPGRVKGEGELCSIVPLVLMLEMSSLQQSRFNRWKPFSELLMTLKASHQIFFIKLSFLECYKPTSQTQDPKLPFWGLLMTLSSHKIWR